MKVGRLRHFITIQEPIESRGADGSVIETWTDHAAAWAAIEPLQGREYFASAAEQSSVTHRIRMRYVAGITTKMRVLFGERIFDIESVLMPLEVKKELVLMVIEGTE